MANNKNLILSIDQGTTSSRAIIFDKKQQSLAMASQDFKQYFPKSGWVEHSPQEIWQSVLNCCRQAIEKAGTVAKNIAAIGITNQRETVLVWQRKTGKVLGNAIVWQDRRTFEFCDELKQQGCENEITKKTGLLLDPYFSATKIRWILENIPKAKTQAENGELLFGTIDTYLIWQFTKGKCHFTDATNASRTMLYNLEKNCWDEDLLKLFSIPKNMLPEILDCSDNFGMVDSEFFGIEIPIYAVAGDQHAACIGNACFEKGMVKSTYGTGCFAMLNTGNDIIYSKNRLLTTLAYRLNGKNIYALEGSIFMAGAIVQWLRDGLEILTDAKQTAEMALHAKDEIYLVPAFTGLGAPYWDAKARGAIFGLTRDSNKNDLAKAALQAVGYQTRDLLEAMKKDIKQKDFNNELNLSLRVDGGMTKNDWLLQFIADQLFAPVERAATLETTSLGVAWLAGERAGIWPSQNEFANQWLCQKRFSPNMPDDERQRLYDGWNEAIGRVLTHN